MNNKKETETVKALIEELLCDDARLAVNSNEWREAKQILYTAAGLIDELSEEDEIKERVVTSEELYTFEEKMGWRL